MILELFLEGKTGASIAKKKGKNAKNRHRRTMSCLTLDWGWPSQNFESFRQKRSAELHIRRTKCMKWQKVRADVSLAATIQRLNRSPTASIEKGGVCETESTSLVWQLIVMLGIKLQSIERRDPRF